ncbi:YchJ family protein [Longispora sp. NPDC051575]|uniref:YchJ family protein n=1 Tax=Longispora sp. NPDC051575 TaxID=3154943 RepID=UPI00343F0A2C
MAPDSCPCGLGEPYPACCGRFHAGQNAPTAETLMRSRFSAFAVGDVAYLLRSWHPDTRPAELDLDTDLRWVRLDVLAKTGGGLFDAEGTVEFRAHYREGGRPGAMHEHSRFLRDNGNWVYLGPV